METRHPVEGYFGSEFRAICNHCGDVAAWSCKNWKFCEQFFAFFFGKTTPYGKILKILFRKFSPLHLSTLLCSNVVKFFRREIGEIVRYWPDEKKQNSAASRRYCSDGAQYLQQCARSAAYFAKIGSLSLCASLRVIRSRTYPGRWRWVVAECVNTVFLPRTVFPW